MGNSREEVWDRVTSGMHHGTRKAVSSLVHLALALKQL